MTMGCKVSGGISRVTPLKIMECQAAGNPSGSIGIMIPFGNITLVRALFYRAFMKEKIPPGKNSEEYQCSGDSSEFADKCMTGVLFQRINGIFDEFKGNNIFPHNFGDGIVTTSTMTKRAYLLPWTMIAGLAILLIGCTFHKALVASFTHDESFTYNHYVTASLHDIFSYEVVSANNHLLNTLLMKTGDAVFGPSPIVLRFPNIMAHLGFIVFSLLLFRKLNPWIILPLFALVNCNPYLLDFFALARGNGLSYGFLMGSIYLYTRFAECNKTGWFIWSLIFALLGVLSHFTLLYYLLALVAVSNLWPMLNRFISGDPAANGLRSYARINLLNLACLLILFVIMSGPVRKLILAGQLFYGGDTGFWKDTTGSLVETFFYGASYGHMWGILVQGLVPLVMISTLALLLYVMIKKDVRLARENAILFIVFLLLLFSVFINVSQFYLVGTKLLIRRYGLLFFPMFMLCSGFLVRAASRQGTFSKLPLIFVYCIALAFGIHTFTAFSQTTYLDWDYEKETGRVVAILGKDVQEHVSPSTITLGISWPFEPTVNFYRRTRGLAWLREVTRDGPQIKADYYYIFRDDMTKVPLDGHAPVILFDDGKTILVKVKRGL